MTLGLADAPRRLALDGFVLRQALDERHRAQLDLLLAQIGEEIVPLADEELTPDALAANITSVGVILPDEQPPDEGLSQEGRFLGLRRSMPWCRPSTTSCRRRASSMRVR